MRDIIQQTINEYKQKRRRRIRFYPLFLALMLIVSGTVFWQLRLEGLSMSGEAYCGLEEHEHSESCIERQLLCTLDEEEVHTHSEENGCYLTTLTQLCPYEEHTHSEACTEYTQILRCTSLEGHQHTEACYASVTELTCAVAEGHSHSESCYDGEGILVCDLEENHIHGESCYTSAIKLVCPIEENHTHGETCYESVTLWVCGKEEHIHEDACFEASSVLTCQKEETEGHTHNDECYEDVYLCGFESEYSHIHDLACYSDPDADLDSPAKWEKTIQGVTLTGNWPEDIIAIAQTQLGYKESTRNYVVREDGVSIKGYTRYGEWYGNPYGEWCAMFASWCIHYAGIGDSQIPYAGSCLKWIDALDNIGLYVPKAYHTPAAGDLVFFDWEIDGQRDGVSDHVAIVSSVQTDEESGAFTLYTIEGNRSNAVAPYSYSSNNPDILGYGDINAAYRLNVAQPAVDETVEGEKTDTAEAIQDEAEIHTLQTLTATVYTDSLYEALLDSSVVITVTGELPENTVVRAYPVEMVIDGMELICAYDISLFLEDGTVFEPASPLSVDIKDNTMFSQELLSEEQETTVYYVPEDGAMEPMESETVEDGVSFVTDHFSVYAVVSGGANTMDVTGYYDEEAEPPYWTGMDFFLHSGNNKRTYSIQFRDGEFGAWQYTGISVKPNKSNRSFTLQLADSNILNSTDAGSVNREFRICTDINTVIGNTVSLKSLYEEMEPGFIAWAEGEYVTVFGHDAPSSIQDLNNAYHTYIDLPTVTITKTVSGDIISALEAALGNGAVIDPATDSFQWQYWDEPNEAWVDFSADVSNTPTQDTSTGPIADVFTAEGKVRCVFYRSGIPLAISNVISNSASPAEIAQAILDINAALGLATTTLSDGSTADLSINGMRFTDRFYYGNVARDDRVPFNNAQEYAEYLALLLLKDGKSFAEIRAVWNKYLYDLYDPSHDMGNMTNISLGYPDNDTYGDESLSWPKDASSNDSSPFHGSVTPVINKLDYSYLEDGVDYGSFITRLDKSAQAVAPGDSNTERKYDIHLHTPVIAKVNAPVAMVLQIQTSWQMFDKNHANALSTDGSTEVGAAVNNTKLANLYDIKQALLRLCDYMERYYPGHNLVLGITDVEHAGTYSMFTGTDSSNKALYVTNDMGKIRQGLYGWDSFGNCEHVHYTNTALVNAVSNLESNLSGWEDMYGYQLKYNEIRKVGVMIGGLTEATAGTNGYQLTLPWNSFASAQLNSVYGIRVNEGTPIGSHLISWTEYSGNNGTPFADGVGNGFTKKYVASNEDAIFNALLEIVRTEMTAQGIDIFNPEVAVDNYHLEDVVQDEFVIDYSKPFTLTVVNKILAANSTEDVRPEDYIDSTTLLSIDMSSVTPATVDGETVRVYDGISFQIPLMQGISTVTGSITVTEKLDGTSKMELSLNKAFNNSTIDLDFGVQAKEDYIGSNNVYTNVGTPELHYQHTDATTQEPRLYPISSSHEPKVNVPIRFSTEDGNRVTIFVGEEQEVAELAHRIVSDAEWRAKRYEQINGTLTYTWNHLPGGSSTIASVTLQDGEIIDNNGLFPDYGYLFEGTEAGNFPGTLEVTFTPLLTDDSSRLGVAPRTEDGDVAIRVVAPDSSIKLMVEKQWPQGRGNNTQVQFHLLRNGIVLPDEGGQPAVYTLNEDNDWKWLFMGLPAVVQEGGNNVLAQYSVEEINPPAGYMVNYAEGTETITKYATQINTITFYSSIKANDKNTLEIKLLSLDGSYPLTLTFEKDHWTIKEHKVGSDRYYEYHALVSSIPLQPADAMGNAHGFTIESVRDYNGNNSVVFTPYNVDVETQLVTNGTEEVSKCIILNRPGIVLPETGGHEPLLYLTGAVLLSAAAIIYGSLFGRRRKERRSVA